MRRRHGQEKQAGEKEGVRRKLLGSQRGTKYKERGVGGNIGAAYNGGNLSRIPADSTNLKEEEVEECVKSPRVSIIEPINGWGRLKTRVWHITHSEERTDIIKGGSEKGGRLRTE